MRKIFYLIIICYFSEFLCAFADDYIVAKVNNKAVTKSELDDRYRFVLFVAKINVKNKQDELLLLSQIVDKMIDEELIKQDAASLKIDVSPAQMRDAINEVAAGSKKNATQLKLSIINRGLSFNNYLNQVESEILWSNIISEVLRSKVKVTDAEVREFFEQQKFNTNIARFRIAEIFIPKSDHSKQFAEKLVAELKQGADFKNVVKQFSTGLNVDNNGELGWVSQNDIDLKIYQAIDKIPIGSYSEPVLLSDGYFIFKVLEKKTEVVIADKDLNAAKNIVFSKKLQTIAKGYLMDLRRNAFIEKSHNL